jgi:hypothetical protein
LQTLRFNPAQTSGSCNSAVLSIRCDTLRTGLPPPPVICRASNPRRVTSALITLPLYSYSFRIRRAITVAFALPSFLPARRSSCISRANEFASTLLGHRPSSASGAEVLLRAAGPYTGARRRLLRPCRIAPAHARTSCVLGRVSSCLQRPCAAHTSARRLPRTCVCALDFPLSPLSSNCPS